MALQTTNPDGTRQVQKTVTVLQPRDVLYRYWRNFEQLPRFMDHVESVRVEDETRSHWVVKAPADQVVQWDAEIYDELEGERIAWRSLPGSQIENHGQVRFRDAPEEQGTEVEVVLTYHPPAGNVGALAAKLFGEEPSQQLDEDLYRFKQLMEAGRIPTTDGQPRGGR